jgi:hypothetical protein
LREDVESPPIHEPEVADVDGNLNLGDPVEGTVEGVRRRPLEPCLPLARSPNRVDDVVALAPPLSEVEDDLRRILQVCIQHDDGVPGREVYPCRERDLMPEVPREPDQPKPGILARR